MSSFLFRLNEREESLSRDSDFLDAAGLTAGQVDAKFFGGAEQVFLSVAHFDGSAVTRQNLDVETQGLHFLDENLEGFGDTRFRHVLALNDRLVDLDAAKDVIGLDGEEFLQCIGGSVSLQRPHFHFCLLYTSDAADDLTRVDLG